MTPPPTLTQRRLDPAARADAAVCGTAVDRLRAAGGWATPGPAAVRGGRMWGCAWQAVRRCSASRLAAGRVVRVGRRMVDVMWASGVRRRGRRRDRVGSVGWDQDWAVGGRWRRKGAA